MRHWSQWAHTHKEQNLHAIFCGSKITHAFVCVCVFLNQCIECFFLNHSSHTHQSVQACTRHSGNLTLDRSVNWFYSEEFYEA